MKMTDLFLNKLEREAAGTRRGLERVPEGRNDWKPHDKSMRLGYLAALVASMPSWIDFMRNRNELDMSSAESSKFRLPEATTSRELLPMLDQSVAKARAALTGTTDEHLMTRGGSLCPNM